MKIRAIIPPQSIWALLRLVMWTKSERLWRKGYEGSKYLWFLFM